MNIKRISRPDRHIAGEITLDGSKSISNRALIINALCGCDFPISNLSTSEDTRLLVELLTHKKGIFDAGNAGTTFRFLTAYFAVQPGSQVLTGSERMKERPIGALVTALNRLGADIEFIENDGFPPVFIHPPRRLGKHRRVSVPATISSQFISSLLMIGPYLPEGLEIELVGEAVSRSYIQMTIEQMSLFGAEVVWEGRVITVRPGGYQGRPFAVESDWSAASYFYQLAAFSESISLKINGLHRESWQGDAVLPALFEPFGVKTTFGDGHILLEKTGRPPHPFFEKDFIDCPDIAQTLAVTCAGLGVKGIFSGLDTLGIKETDRVAALTTELAKLGVPMTKLPPHFNKKQPGKTFFQIDGKAAWPERPPRFASHGDHRMALAFAPLGIFSEIEIEEPEVVGKSYPGFWEDLGRLGFRLSDV